MGNMGDHIRGFAHRMTYEEYEELEDTVTEMFRHKNLYFQKKSYSHQLNN